jgi:hypothetical protein
LVYANEKANSITSNGGVMLVINCDTEFWVVGLPFIGFCMLAFSMQIWLKDCFVFVDPPAQGIISISKIYVI